MNRWSRWRPFPDPRLGACLSAPFGPGVYELRNGASGELVLFGRSKNVARRMSSLLPRPFGAGTRDNAGKRDHVLKHLADMEYRTKACTDERAALTEERKLRAANTYRFGT